MLKTVQWSVTFIIIVVVVVVFVGDDTYYWVYLSFEHLFQVDKVQQVLLHSATGITKCDNFIAKCDRYTKYDDYYLYKVRQKRPEVRLPCEYSINPIRRRFQNYHTISRAVSKNLLKTRVVLNYQPKLLRPHLFFFFTFGINEPSALIQFNQSRSLNGRCPSYFTDLHFHELSL